VIGVDRPAPAAATAKENDYVFERAVKRHTPDSTPGSGRIDLYKRGGFVLEAKQSRQSGGTKQIEVQYLPGMDPPTAWLARRQPHLGRADAERQAPGRGVCSGIACRPWMAAVHSWSATFGHVIEVYADLSG
jgi:hypothetical protein